MLIREMIGMKQNKKKNKNKKIVLLIILIVLLVSWIGIVTTDFIRASKEKEPIFAVHTSTYWDGGTKTYIGLGYMIIDYNQLSLYDANGNALQEGRTDMVFRFWFLPFEF